MFGLKVKSGDDYSHYKEIQCEISLNSVTLKFTEICGWISPYFSGVYLKLEL